MLPVAANRFRWRAPDGCSHALNTEANGLCLRDMVVVLSGESGGGGEWEMLGVALQAWRARRCAVGPLGGAGSGSGDGKAECSPPSTIITTSRQ